MRRDAGVFPLGFLREALAIASDRDERQLPAAEHVRHRAVAGIQAALNLNRVPALGVADVLDRDVVVLTPEKRNSVEAFATAQHVACRDLTLPLRDHPV